MAEPVLPNSQKKIKSNLTQSKKCQFCNSTFYRPKNYSSTQWDDRKFCSRKCGATKIKVTHDDIIYKYILLEMSSPEIAGECGISDTHVRRILKQSNVKIRSRGEYQKLSANRPEVIAKHRKASTGRTHKESSKDKLRALVGPKSAIWKAGLTISQGYLCFTKSPANGAHANMLLHRVIAEWKYGRSVRPGEHVHHVDGNKLNNSPENIQILSASEHTILHTEDRENGKLKSMSVHRELRAATGN